MLKITKEFLEEKGFVRDEQAGEEERWQRTIIDFDVAFVPICEAVGFDLRIHSEDFGWDYHGMDLYLTVTCGEAFDNFAVHLIADFRETSVRYLDEDDRRIQKVLDNLQSPEKHAEALRSGLEVLTKMPPEKVFKRLFPQMFKKK